MSDERLDVEIDRAVREMMSVDAPGGFRARILSKLEERPQRFGWMTFAGVGTLGAAAAVVLLMLRAPAPVQQGPTPTTPPEVSTKTAPPSPDATAPASVPHVRSRPSPRDVARASASERQVFAAIIAAEPETTISALQEIDPLVIPAISARDTSPAALTIAPLPAIPELQVKPLFPPDGRD